MQVINAEGAMLQREDQAKLAGEQWYSPHGKGRFAVLAAAKGEVTIKNTRQQKKQQKRGQGIGSVAHFQGWLCETLGIRRNTRVVLQYSTVAIVCLGLGAFGLLLSILPFETEVQLSPRRLETLGWICLMQLLDFKKRGTREARNGVSVALGCAEVGAGEDLHSVPEEHRRGASEASLSITAHFSVRTCAGLVRLVLQTQCNKGQRTLG